jgi:hypothetical protein
MDRSVRRTIGDTDDMLVTWGFWFIPGLGILGVFLEWISQRNFYFEKPKWFLKFTNQDIK